MVMFNAAGVRLGPAHAEGSAQSSPRMRCSQADHPVAGRVGSVHPAGQPIIQSEKFGLKVRSPAEYRAPVVKLMWSGREDGKLKGRVGRPPQAVVSSHISVQVRATLPSATCDPVCVGSSRNFSVFPISTCTRLQ